MTYARIHFLLGLSLAAGVAGAADNGDAIRITPLRPHTFYLTPGQKALLAFEVVNGTHDRQIAYTLSDYWGTVVGESTATVDAAGRLQVPVCLPQGYHQIAFPLTDQRFGIVVRPTIQPNPDSVFCLDAGMSWASCPGMNRIDKEAMARLLADSGIGMARERLSWWTVCPGIGQFAWDTPKGALKYQQIRNAYAKAGLKILENFGPAPGWTGATLNKQPEMPFVRRLLETADSWEGMAEQFADAWGAIEVSNEPDHVPVPADYYLPMAKAIAWGLHEAGWDGKLVGGVFARNSGPYMANAAENGLLDVCDVVSFHHYGHPGSIQAYAKMYRDYVTRYHRPSMEVWLGESGFPWTPGPPRPDARSDNQSARVITMKGVECHANGIARYFAFYLQYQKESIGNFGMSGREMTPLRSMAAYLQAARVVGPKAYLGNLRIDHPAVELARVFGRDGQCVAVVYTRSVSPDQVLNLDLPVLRVEGIDGRVLKPAADGAIPIPDGMGYVYLDPVKATRHIVTDTPAAALLKRAAGAKHKRQPVPVALQPMIPLTDVPGKRQGGYYLDESQAAEFDIPVGATNFTDRPRRVTLRLKTDPAVTILSGPAARTVTIPPRSRHETRWTCNLRAGLGTDVSDPLVVHVYADGADGHRIDRMAMRFLRRERAVKHNIPKAIGQIVVDGRLGEAEWLHVPAIEGLAVTDPAAPNARTPSDDLSAEAKFQWTPDGLYFAVRVHDQAHRQGQSTNLAWREDSLQVAVASLYDPDQPFRQARYEFGFDGHPDGPRAYRYLPSKAILRPPAEWAIVRDEQAGVTLYEGKLPWSQLAPIQPGPNRRFYMTVLVNDADGGQRKWIAWTPGIAEGKEIADYAEVTLTP